MKPETILNACLLASYYMEDCEKHTWEYYNRQYCAFRSRILRMFEWRNIRIGDLEHKLDSWAETCARQHDEVIRLKRKCGELDE